MVPELKELLKKIEEKLQWGDSTTWQNRDFENLNERILSETGVSLSASTLRRLWGKVEYNHMPSTTTLDTLSKFAGYTSWRTFQKNGVATTETEQSLQTAQQPLRQRYKPKRIWSVVIIVGMALIGWVLIKNPMKPVEPSAFSFSSEPVARDIPNSVIFTYDASAASDSVFIQQSWDERTRAFVDKDKHTFTSIYYEPGFYQAKLVVGNEVVQEHPVLIPTRGWLGVINNEPIPVYLDSSEFIHTDKLQLSIADIMNKHVDMQPQTPIVRYSNVGNFEPVPVSDFIFTTDVKHEYHEGTAACQQMYVLLITDQSVLTIPLSVKGCVSELKLRGPDELISGQNEDLSGFGVDFTDWVHVTCRSDGKKIHYLIDDKEVYTLPLTKMDGHIIGIAYAFIGTGAVKNVRLREHDHVVFEAF